MTHRDLPSRITFGFDDLGFGARWEKKNWPSMRKRLCRNVSVGSLDFETASLGRGFHHTEPPPRV